MNQLKLYDYYRSSACFRVRIALALKNLPYEKISIHLLNHGGEQHSTHYQQINPHHLVPSLQSGDKIITQSLAIIEYLNEEYPTPALLPNNTYHKALARAFALSIAADIHPLNNLRVLNYLTQELHINETQKNAWYQHWIQKGLLALEKQLEILELNTTFCLSDTPSLADICLAPQMYNAKRFKVDISNCPRLLAIDARCQKHPAFKEAWPVEANETIKG